MTAIGFFMMMTGLITVGLIGEFPGLLIGTPILAWTFGGVVMFCAGLSKLLWTVMP